MGYIEGIADTSIIIPVCFKNPLKKSATEFIAKILTLKRRIIIPIPAILGAYHIVTRYLRVSRFDVRKILVEMLQTESPALYPKINVDMAVDSLEMAAIYNIESWDSYLVALAKSLGAKTIFTLDKEMEKVAEVRIETPFHQQLIEEYHKYIKTHVLIRRKREGEKKK